MSVIWLSDGQKPFRQGFHQHLKNREYGKARPMFGLALPDKIAKKINSDFSNIIKHTKSLKKAVTSRNWKDIENAVSDVMHLLIDQHSSEDMSGASKKQMTQLFIEYGGMDYFLQVFATPISPTDARSISRTTFRARSETWSELLITIRELIITQPSLADRYFDTNHIVFIFTMLHHSAIFESAINALEEILASREDPFPLQSIPNFYQLVRSFSSRHLAHFCRILSLLVFEPEDRHLLEGTHVLRSVDLLKIRRTRMVKTSNCIVEKNQNMMIQLPEFIPRMVQLLTVINHGPELSEFIRRNIISQLPITTDIFNFASTAAGVSDWDHFKRMEEVLKTEREISAASSPSRRSPGTPPTQASSVDEEETRLISEMLDAFSPQNEQGAMDINNLINVMLVADRMNIAEITSLGQAFIFSQPLTVESPNGGLNPQQQYLRNRLRSRGYSGQASAAITPSRARQELQFHAMLLSPHQVEIIFVLCTLLSGRRKIFVQDRLSQLGVDAVLVKLFDRMSWGAPPFSGPQEHIHGPNCECNPENAVRIQVLRLIHNYYDRDFLGNANKFTLLSPDEQAFITSQPYALAEDGAGLGKGLLNAAPKGLISNIIQILAKQPADSTYRFWLSACIENFLRGCGRRGQVFVTERGALLNTVRSIFDAAAEGTSGTVSANNAYQTSFDLVGEIIKCNPRILEFLEAELSDEEFRGWIRICLDNLVDSNVFLRSLFLTMEIYHTAMTHHYGMESFERFGYVENALCKNPQQLVETRHKSTTFGYLTATWTQEHASLSAMAVNQYKDKKELQDRRAKAKVAKSSAVKGMEVKVKRSSELRGPTRNSGDFNDESSSSTTGRPPRTAISPAATTVAVAAAVSKAHEPTASPAKHFLEATAAATRSYLGNLMSSLTSGGSSASSSTTAATQKASQSTSIWDASEVPVVPRATSSDKETSRRPINVDTAASDTPSFRQNVSQGRDDLDAFFTPPQGPQFWRNSGSSKSAIAELEAHDHAGMMEVVSEALQDMQFSNQDGQEDAKSMDNGLQPSQLPSFLTPKAVGASFDFKTAQQKETATAKDSGSVRTERTAAAPLTIQPKLFRFSMFLMQEKVTILLRLMTTVSMYTINHENICCLNTTLLILLFDYQRLTLAQTLQKIRDVADNFSPVIAQLMKERNSQKRRRKPVAPILCVHLLSNDHSAATTSATRCGCAIPSECASSLDSGSDEVSGKGGKGSNNPQYKIQLKRVAQDQAIHKYLASQQCQEEANHDDIGDEDALDAELTNGEIVMRNFRELLWYWREYYLRRGRDRLSIEFSSHISFDHFNDLVGALCADDGSSHALLSTPMPAPHSPYQMSNLECLLESRSSARPNLIHL